jgi:hypothetical protein
VSSLKIIGVHINLTGIPLWIFVFCCGVMTALIQTHIGAMKQTVQGEYPKEKYVVIDLKDTKNNGTIGGFQNDNS